MATHCHLLLILVWVITAGDIKLRHKKTRRGGFFVETQTESLQFDFLVFHVLASFRVEFHDRHFLGHGFLVFAGGVEVTGASS